MILSYPTHPNPAHPCLSSEYGLPVQWIASGAWTERSLAYAVRADSRSHQLQLPAQAVHACLAPALYRLGFVNVQDDEHLRSHVMNATDSVNRRRAT